MAAAAEAFRACAPTFRAFGDCSKVGNVKTAVRGAFEAALTLGRIPGEAWEA